jgi:hypothetical protein
MRDYVDARMDDHRQVHAAEERALQAAADAMASRFEGVNEFRQALAEQSGSFVTRAVLDAIVAASNARMEVVASEARRTAIGAGVAAGLLGLVGGALLARLLA